MNELDDIKQNEQKDLKLINESDFFITICEQYKTKEKFLKDNFQETLKKNRDYLELCNFMGYRQLNDLICEYAEKIRNCDIIDFNKFLSENNGSPIWNHLELLEENLDKVNWSSLSGNPAAIHLLEREIKDAENEARQSRVDWVWLSGNPAAIHILEKNLKKVDWDTLSGNPAAIHLLGEKIKLEKSLSSDQYENLKKKRKVVNWEKISSNPTAIHLLEQNPDKVKWKYLSENPAAIHLLAREIEDAENKGRQSRVDWHFLSKNPAAIHLLKQNLNQVDWSSLSVNPAAIDLLEKNLNKVNLLGISQNPAAVPLLEKEIAESKNQGRYSRVDWFGISLNPAATHLFETNLNKIHFGYLLFNKYQYLKEKLIVLEKMELLPDGLNTKTILQTYIQCLKKKERYDDYIIYSNIKI